MASCTAFRAPETLSPARRTVKERIPSVMKHFMPSQRVEISVEELMTACDSGMALGVWPAEPLVSAERHLSVPLMARLLGDVIALRLTGGPVSSVALPSFSALAECFQCTCLDVYDVFRALRGQGYDYQFLGLDGQVRVWRSGAPRPV